MSISVVSAVKLHMSALNEASLTVNEELTKNFSEEEIASICLTAEVHSLAATICARAVKFNEDAEDLIQRVIDNLSAAVKENFSTINKIINEEN